MIPALLKDSAQTAVQNADPRIRTFFVEPGIVIAAGDWVGVDLATSTMGVGNSIGPLDTGVALIPVGVATEAAAPVAGGDDVWITVVTRGVSSGLLAAGVTASDRLGATAVPGSADTTILVAGDRIGYALEASGAGGVVHCYVTCE
tara:strand:- start:7902 stop:8339 length:438 start_codon:yes stop_codon:yes gene_type:complete